MWINTFSTGKSIIGLGRLPHALRATYSWVSPAIVLGFSFGEPENVKVSNRLVQQYCRGPEEE